MRSRYHHLASACRTADDLDAIPGGMIIQPGGLTGVGLVGLHMPAGLELASPRGCPPSSRSILEMTPEEGEDQSGSVSPLQWGPHANSHLSPLHVYNEVSELIECYGREDSGV